MAVVRRATEPDIPDILKLYRQLSIIPGEASLYQNPPLEDCRQTFADMCRIPGYELLVAEEDNRLVGTTFLAILPGFTHGTSPFAVVENVVVDEDYRRKGIGRLLMDFIIARSREAGCYKIMLTSDRRRLQAHEFYRSLGFEDSACGFRLYF